MKEDCLYTSGEVAKIAGVTVRTIRYYDTKGILIPSKYSSSGHRLYSNEDIKKLKRVLVLKYLGLTLEEIKRVESQSFEKNNMVDSLSLQKNIIKNKINHMKTVLSAIEIAENSFNSEENIDLNQAIDVIKILEEEKVLLQQYIDASNLNANIKLQDRFGQNENGWYQWVFKNMKLNKSFKVLEIGCGNGALWEKNINCLDKNIDITLTDICEDMLKETKQNLSKYNHNFKFKLADPSNIPFENETFDVVIANHILFYMKDLDKVLYEINRVLKKNGEFYCSTIDNSHMKELEDIMLRFNCNINISEKNIYSKFSVDNGESILKKYFKDINKCYYTDELIVDDTKGILEYIYTIPGNILEIIDTKKKEFESYIDVNINKQGELKITNSNVLFNSKKI